LLWDQAGDAIIGDEAARRIASFHAGPCPVFTYLTGDGHATQAFTNSAAIGIRLLTALAVFRRRWKQHLQPRLEATHAGGPWTVLNQIIQSMIAYRSSKPL
jgi:hypothetical protein